MNIYAGKIPTETTEAELREAFEKFGKVESVTMIKDKYTNAFKGFAFIEMPDKEEAQKAIDGLDNSTLNGAQIAVNQAKPKSESGKGQKRYGSRY
jgi:RNA recognition motif-containing protein